MDYQAGSFPLGRIFGIPIRLHCECSLVASHCCLLGVQQHNPDTFSTPCTTGLFLLFLVLQVLASIRPNSLWPLYWFLILGPILLVTVLLHELGHCLAARSVGGTAHSILLWPLGGLAYIGSHNKGPKADVWVAVAGPLTHVPMTAFWVLMLLVATYVAYGTTHITLVWPAYLTIHNLGVAVCVGAVVLNISLFAFNLLVPAYPLDGGRILVGSLLSCGVAVRTTALITCGLAVPLAIGIIVFGGRSLDFVHYMGAH
eukprot:GHRR01036901.1.p1 GENE.GHRR01036901.1~~GHRR01036901.1.p1  ORF type:complete len:257 (+),score=33.10 GHRR01036901.1:855-1625(+)